MEAWKKGAVIGTIVSIVWGMIGLWFYINTYSSLPTKSWIFEIIIILPLWITANLIFLPPIISLVAPILLGTFIGALVGWKFRQMVGKRLAYYIIFTIVLLYLVYPKNVGGTCGRCSPDEIVRWEYGCIGLKNEFQTMCQDCGLIITCRGLDTPWKKCYSYPKGFDEKSLEVSCPQGHKKRNLRDFRYRSPIGTKIA